MYVLSVKLDVKKVLSVIAVLCIVIAVSFVLFQKQSSDVLSNDISRSAKNTSEHVDFLDAYGYNIYDKPIQIQEIIIPEKFSDDYLKYNELQKLSGLDLSDYKGYRAKKYTYKVLDYANSNDEVVANLIVYNNMVIGADISSTTLGGFVHGLVKE